MHASACEIVGKTTSRDELGAIHVQANYPRSIDQPGSVGCHLLFNFILVVVKETQISLKN